MLVISRKRDETIVIGDGIEITVVDIRGDKVRIGVSCPAEVPVHRREVYEAIQRCNSWGSTVSAEPAALKTQAAAPAVAVAPATSTKLSISPASAERLDKLRATSELSRDSAVEALLEVVDRAQVQSLCDLERRLER
jgi:carbon storage regulator